MGDVKCPKVGRQVSLRISAPARRYLSQHNQKLTTPTQTRLDQQASSLRNAIDASNRSRRKHQFADRTDSRLRALSVLQPQQTALRASVRGLSRKCRFPSASNCSTQTDRRAETSVP